MVVRYWQRTANASLLSVRVRCRLGHINKAKNLRGQSCWGYNLRALYWKEIHVCVCALLFCVLFSVCFTKTTHSLLGSCGLCNIMIMHCDSSTPGPCVLSRDFFHGEFLGRLQSSNSSAVVCLSSSRCFALKQLIIIVLASFMYNLSAV